MASTNDVGFPASGNRGAGSQPPFDSKNKPLASTTGGPPKVTKSGGPTSAIGSKKRIHRSKLHKPKVHTAKEKKERIWGKTPQKPYISSSLGDMARVMMRYACMESTYFYNAEPPPVEFYDYWQKFSVEQGNLPSDFVDRKRASHANIKKNTSSFDFFGQYTAPIRSSHDMDTDAAAGQKQRKKMAAPNLADMWKDVRISMSTESFLSSSTKISEDASMVPIENGWDEVCSEDYQSSESDFGLDVQDKCRHHRHKQHQMWAAGGLDSQAKQDVNVKQSALEFHTPQGLIEKQAEAIAKSILAMQQNDNRILYELATQPRDLDLIDHFADDLDDSFLLDSYSYSELPDEAFGPDFDFLNEDKIVKKKGKKRRSGKGMDSGKDTTTMENPEDGVGSDEEADDASDDECAVDENKEKCERKRKKMRKGKTRSSRLLLTESIIGENSPGEGGYEACLERRRRRIEDSLRAAVRCRSPMGSYRPKPGKPPLAKTFMSSSPGPAAYNPTLEGVKPNVHTTLLMSRWSKNIYKSLGPGPAAYLPEGKCTCKMLDLHFAPRFVDDETLGPGPGNVNLSGYKGTAKNKPKAIILSRKSQTKTLTAATFTNCYGLTRFGKDSPPKPVFVGKYTSGKEGGPGPGEYDPSMRKDTRIGIKMKSRKMPNDLEKSPGFYYPEEPVEDAGFTFGIRKFMEMKDQSPGPIYQLPSTKPKPVSLTFRPFSPHGAEMEPSPMEWGEKPGIAKNYVLRKAPRAVIYGSHETAYLKSMSPGPNQYSICLTCPECTEPGASLKGRTIKKLESTPGPGDYDPIPVWKRPPYPLLQSRHLQKVKLQPPFVMYDVNVKQRITGGSLASRWPEKESEQKGPELVNIFGLTNRGKKGGIPISMKSRHTPFKYSHMAEPHQITFEEQSCYDKVLNSTDNNVPMKACKPKL